MARMTLEKLNELLERALRGLADERATAVTGWFDQHVPEFPPPVYIPLQDVDGVIGRAKAKAERRAQDERLMNASVEELLGDQVPKMWEPQLGSTWGTKTMKQAGGTLKAPTVGNVQPSYDFECYQCGRPITNNDGDWCDHNHDRGCEATLMDDPDDAYPWHTPKPWHGEEEDD